MTPEQFSAWVTGGMAVLWGLAKVTAFVAEHFGLRPQDRRVRERTELVEAEEEIARLRQEIAELRATCRECDDRVRDAWRERDLLEGVLRRMGMRVRRTPEGTVEVDDQ